MSTIVPLTLREAKTFVKDHHRHNKPPQGHRFSIGLRDEAGELVAVAIVGRTVARKLHAGTTAEVTRLCVNKSAPRNACSMLYRAAWRAWKEMGGRLLYTYTLQSESGASLRGAGFIRDAELPGSKGKAWQTRERREAQPVVREPKVRWKIEATA